LKIGVHSLGPEPTLLEAAQTPQELHLAADGVEFAQPVDVAAKLTRMQEDVLAQGQARTTARLECSRCLEPVQVELAGKFETLYVPDTGPYASRMGRRDFEWGDQRVSFYSGSTIDLTDELRQCLLLELPLKPLCRPDCAGLCPQCGQNLNEGLCECKPDEGDDAWAALRKLIPPSG
jgi:uncharacterized protein